LKTWRREFQEELQKSRPESSVKLAC